MTESRLQREATVERLRHRSSGRRIGFTLIEVLLATVLGAGVVAVGASVTVQSLMIQESVETHLMRDWARVRLLDQFEADVRGELAWLPEKARTLVLPTEPERLMEVVCLTDSADGRSSFRRRMPARIWYVVEDSANEPDDRCIFRVVQDLTTPQTAPIRQLLADNIAEARIEWLTSEGWVENALPREVDQKGVRALRLTCRWSAGSDRSATRTVLRHGWNDEAVQRRGAEGL